MIILLEQERYLTDKLLGVFCVMKEVIFLKGFCVLSRSRSRFVFPIQFLFYILAGFFFLYAL